MREKQFVRQNTEKWRRYESASAKGFKGKPGELGEMYTDITNDLAFAKTFYPHRSIRLYLNKLAKDAHLLANRFTPSPLIDFLSFWVDDLPAALYRCRREIDLSFTVFAVAILIGILSSENDPQFALAILGEEYIIQTEENIRNGIPMGVYQSLESTDMFFYITLNNIRVALTTYVLGIFIGVGTIMILLSNGVMVGTFQHYFVDHDLLQESFLTIWMHGAFEISAIVIAGGAGLALGRGLLFPGTLPRMLSFRLSARRSIKIMLGLIPVFIGAAFIESFITRLTDVPDVIRATFIVSCFALSALYFRIYPYLKFRHTDPHEVDRDELLAETPPVVEFKKLRSTKEVFMDSFVVYRKAIPFLVFAVPAAGILYALALWLVYGGQNLPEIPSRWSLFAPRQYFDFMKYPQNFYLNGLFLIAVIFTAFKAIQKPLAESGYTLKTGVSLLLKIAVSVALFQCILLANHVVITAIGVIVVPYLLFALTVSAIEGMPLYKTFGRMRHLLSRAKRHLFITYAFGAFIGVVLLFIASSPLTYFYMDVVQWTFGGEGQTRMIVLKLCVTAVLFAVIAMTLPLILYGQVLEFSSARETTEPEELSAKVRDIGKKSKAYGLETE